MMLDINNMRKDWKSASTRRVEAVQRARISQNRQPEPVRCFPGDVRPVSIPSDSPVAMFAQSSNTGKTRRKDDLPAAAETVAELGGYDAGEKQKEVAPLLMKNTYLALDQSKLPLEVRRLLLAVGRA